MALILHWRAIGGRFFWGWLARKMRSRR